MANVLRQISQIIYRLKRNYGLPAVLRVHSNVINIETGAISDTPTDYSIARMVLLPQKSRRDFAYDLSYIAANKNFTYGGLFDASQRTVIIDAKDLPAGVRPTQDMTIVFNNRPWEIAKVDRAEFDRGYLLTVKEVSSVENV